MIVVDTSALTTMLLGDDPRSTVIEARLDDEHLLVPELLDLEAVSTVRRLLLSGEIDELTAQGALQALSRLPLERCSHRPLLPRIWELRENVSPYDAAYVALAESVEAPLVTTDGRLARAPGIRCVVELIR